MFYVNAGILFYIAFVVNNHLQFCKINGIAFEFIKRYTQTMNMAGSHIKNRICIR